MHDLVIRAGTLIDGTGAPAYEGDVAVTDGKIVEIGIVHDRGQEEIDARGQLVTPGFVDIHTHYDGQVVWSNCLSPSSWHGVTTAVMGNCGVGFAPCRPEQQDMLIRLMEGVEDIPGVVLTEGLTWEWESFSEYLDTLSQRTYDIDFATQVPHAALRVYVMGQRGADREPATPEECARMASLAAEAIQAGALGFSTSRTLNHRTSDGDPTPTLTATEDELMAIAIGLKNAGQGVLQFVSDFNDLEEEFAMLHRLSEHSGRPLSVSLTQKDKVPGRWERMLNMIGQAVDDGVPMKAQVCGRAVGLLFGLELTHNSFARHPSYRKIAGLPHQERVGIMRQEEFRRQLLSEQAEEGGLKRWFLGFDKMYELGNPPNYEPDPATCIADRARVQGISPEELVYDIMMENDGRGMLYRPLFNYSDGNLEATRSMLVHRDTLIGLSDGGAHVGTICDASLPTFMLTHWARDRSRGDILKLPIVIKAQTSDTAKAVGLNDRGILAPGYKADINIIDFDRLRLHPPEVGYDLPKGGRRLLQRADGFTATVVSGQIVYRNGEATGVLPGRLVRGARSIPEARPT